MKSYKIFIFVFLVSWLNACSFFGGDDDGAIVQPIAPETGQMMMDYMPEEGVEPSRRQIQLNLPSAIAEPMWIQNAALPKFSNSKSRPKIVIVIDDLGIVQDNAWRAASLPGPITMAYLPYAHNLRDMTAAAHANGHELMVHMPMQPLNDAADPGPNALTVGLKPAELKRRIQANLNAFDHYVGVNNHMGSRFTQEQAGLEVLMAELQKRDVLYLDSRTSATSVAEPTARRFNVATTGRDIFLDHVISKEFIEGALKRTEDHAKKHGSAIAIGHPHDLTLDALEKWLPTLKRKGFDLVPITAVMTERDVRIQGITSSAFSH